MRNFPYWTLGKIIRVLKADGMEGMNRQTFYYREEKKVLPVKDIHRTEGKWRTFTDQEAVEIMVFFWGDFYGKEKAIEYRKKLEDRYLTRRDQ